MTDSKDRPTDEWVGKYIKEKLERNRSKTTASYSNINKALNLLAKKKGLDSILELDKVRIIAAVNNCIADKMTDNDTEPPDISNDNKSEKVGNEKSKLITFIDSLGIEKERNMYIAKSAFHELGLSWNGIASMRTLNKDWTQMYRKTWYLTQEAVVRLLFKSKERYISKFIDTLCEEMCHG